MNKNILPLLFIILIFTSCSSSKILYLKLRNGQEITDNFIVNSKSFKSTTDKTIYPFDSILDYRKENSKKIYSMLHIISYPEKKKVSGIGFRVYEGEKLEIYHADFRNLIFSPYHTNEYNQRASAFVKKKNEYYAYSLGFLDGYGWKDTNKRIKEFFKDCPELIEKLDKAEIGERQLLKLVEFYEKICGQ